MDYTKRQDEITLIKALLNDIHMSHEALFNSRSLRLTCKQVERRVALEGLGFLTKTLPKLGKAFDKALAGGTPLNAVDLKFARISHQSKLPRFLGELFSVVLSNSGVLLPGARAEHVRCIRQVLYLFYKYELPYTPEQEQKVLKQFLQTESDLSLLQPLWPHYEALLADVHTSRMPRRCRDTKDVVRKARILLARVFSGLDLHDIIPRHGPGAVATRQQL